MKTSPSRTRRLSALLVLVSLLVAVGACTQTTGEAIVISKEFIPAATEETKNNERVTDRDQWIVETRMVRDQRVVNVRADKPVWDRLKEGDRVTVSYSAGKYTGTVWGSDIH